ncbi:MAG: hypothetical protein HOO92_09390 [Methylococcaceae bacterium]|nr:hypothetical protein [Methylococcaceae bacterium]
MPKPFANLKYPFFKLALITLLVLNATLYALVDTLTSTLDAVSWLILLIIYELETSSNRYFSKTTLQVIRNAAIALIVLVFVSYWHDSEWLDITNSLLWFGIIALLELDIHKPNIVLRHSTIIWTLTITIFLSLFVMAGIWLWQGAWLDAYDALLWIIAFALIEVDFFEFLQKKCFRQDL